MSWAEKFEVSVPNGRRGPWRVDRFTATSADCNRYNRSLLFGGAGARQMYPGTYVRLWHEKRGVVMSSTRAELSDHIEPWQMAKGRCLINGLGLGIITAACLRKPEVEHITVVELDKDVITLVAPWLYETFDKKRLTIVNADAHEYRPKIPVGTKFTMVWHDIWDEISEANRGSMSKLHRRYGRISEWQGSWGRPFLDAQRARDRRYAWP
jgi:hypothetical protein